MERTTAIVFDDLDSAPSDASEGITRLVGAAEPRYSRTVVVATVTPQGLASVPLGLRQRAAVRIELSPWNVDDVGAFLASSLHRVGGVENIFSTDAIATLTRFAAGVPRVVSQLAQLSLIAAAGDQLPQIDAVTVERAWRELAPSGAVETSPAETEDETLPVNPRVRVVRRLWG